MIDAFRRWLYIELARWSKAFGQGDTALKFYKLALEVRPDDAVVLASVGFELAQQGRKRDALAWFDRAVAARPNYAEGHFDRGYLLQQLNDPEAAIAAFNKALEFDPNHDRALYGKALSLIGLHRQDEAVAPLEKNTKLQPFSPYGWYQLGRVQFDRGKPDKTQAIIEHLATFEPKIAAQLARETGLKLPAS
jgi:tetratricopeptide (TPR) repeat protein